jgi:hypothetical protein
MADTAASTHDHFEFRPGETRASNEFESLDAGHLEVGDEQFECCALEHGER